MNAHFVETATHGRYLLEGPADAVTLLAGFHGYGETAEVQMERLRLLPGASACALAAVQSLHLFYTKANEVVGSWMTRLGREHAIEDNTRYAAAVVADVRRRHLSIERVVYAGFSQGVAMAYRAAARIGQPGDAVFAIGGDLPPDVADDPAARLPPVLVARGLRDEWFTDAKLERDLAALRGRGVPVTSVVFEGAHEWPEPIFAAAAEFLRERAVAP
ncbi:MAG: dienelactone hydrolase family protein [Vicinamibacteria bacterium]